VRFLLSASTPVRDSSGRRPAPDPPDITTKELSMFPTASRNRVLQIVSKARVLTAACAVGFSLLPNVPAAADVPPATDPVSRLSVGVRQGDARTPASRP